MHLYAIIIRLYVIILSVQRHYECLFRPRLFMNFINALNIKGLIKVDIVQYSILYNWMEYLPIGIWLYHAIADIHSQMLDTRWTPCYSSSWAFCHPVLDIILFFQFRQTLSTLTLSKPAVLVGLSIHLLSGRFMLLQFQPMTPLNDTQWTRQLNQRISGLLYNLSHFYTGSKYLPSLIHCFT